MSDNNTPILRHEPMEAASIRIPRADFAAAKKAAKKFRCQLADVFRTAVHEWLARQAKAEAQEGAA